MAKQSNDMAYLIKYIHFYNNERFQVRLGGFAPLEYRALLLTAA